MERYVVTGGTPLRGSVRARGAKNSALKLMAASLLAEGEYVLHDVPRIADIYTMQAVLERLGCGTGFDDSTMRITVPDGIGSEAPYDLVRQMRASIVVLGPLLARGGHARVAMPGGCNIGSRKIDLHLKGLERMGATIGFDHGYLDAGGGLHGADIALDWPSHGATENLMMAATLAKGTTIIENAARDPEIEDLALFLTSMGARIAGAGSPIITIEGVEELRATEHAVVPDRLEAGTLLIAAAATGGDVFVEGARAEHLDIVLSKLGDAGADIIARPASGVRSNTRRFNGHSKRDPESLLELRPPPHRDGSLLPALRPGRHCSRRDGVDGGAAPSCPRRGRGRGSPVASRRGDTDIRHL